MSVFSSSLLLSVMSCVITSTLVDNIVANPVVQTGHHHHPYRFLDLDTVLSSIDSRLRSLDNLYNYQLSPTLEMRLEQYQNRLSGLETKMIHLESLLTSKLDRVADNISARHFRDDMVQTDLFRKIETAYDGMTQRLAYMDRKIETTLLKIQIKNDATLNKLEKIDDTLTTRDEEIDTKLTDSVAAIDDLTTTCGNIDSRIANITKTYLNITNEKHIKMKHLDQNYIEKLYEIFAKLEQNTTSDQLKGKNIGCSSENIENNNTVKIMQILENKIETTMNDYANKVVDINVDTWKVYENITKNIDIIQKVTNATKVELENEMRTVLLQIGKISGKNSIHTDSNHRLIEDINQKIDKNFETIISSQNNFLENCHRVQMDESQIESKISDILEKMIDTFVQTSSEQSDNLKNIEKQLSSHDFTIKRSIHQAKTILLTLNEKTTKETSILNKRVHMVNNNLEAVLALIQNALEKLNNIEQHNLTETNNLKILESSMNDIQNQQKNVSDNLKFIKNILERNSSNHSKDYFSNVYNIIKQLINEIKHNENLNFIEMLHRIEYKINNLQMCIQNPTNNTNETSTLGRVDKNLDDIIKELFLPSNLKKNSLEIHLKKTKECKQSNKDLIDIRSGIINENCTYSEEDNENEQSNEENCLEVDIDVRFSNNDANMHFNNSESTIKKCKKNTNTDGTSQLAKQPITNTESEAIDLNNQTTNIKIESSPLIVNSKSVVHTSIAESSNKTLKALELEVTTVFEHLHEVNDITTENDNTYNSDIKNLVEKIVNT